MDNNNLTLEQELTARIFLHKASIAGGVLAREYMDKELEQGTDISSSQLQELADTYANKVVKEAIANSTFNTLYEDAWDKIKNTIPENLKVL